MNVYNYIIFLYVYMYNMFWTRKIEVTGDQANLKTEAWPNWNKLLLSLPFLWSLGVLSLVFLCMFDQLFPFVVRSVLELCVCLSFLPVLFFLARNWCKPFSQNSYNKLLMTLQYATSDCHDIHSAWTRTRAHPGAARIASPSGSGTSGASRQEIQGN